MATKKSISQKRKEADSHAKAIADAFHAGGTSPLVLDSLRKNLKTVKNDDAFMSWYRSFSHRTGELLNHDTSHAALVRSSLNELARLAGVAR